MNEELLAPVIIPTLCRYEHFKRCVDSLSKCVGANRTDIIIGLDYPLKENQRNGYQLICNYLRNNVRGFHNVEIIERKSNYGANKNIEDLFLYARSKYDAYIFSEDDNEFSPNFLLYINEGLKKYKDDDRVFSISGFCYPVDTSAYKTNVFPLNTYSAFGCGRWSNKHPVVDKEFVNKILYSPVKLYKIYRERPLSLLNFANMVLNNSIYGDVCVGIYLILTHRCSIYPKISKVRNHGYDGTGEHCNTKGHNLFSLQEIDDKDFFYYDTISLDEEKIDTIKKYLKLSLRGKIMAWINILRAQIFQLFH